LPPHFRLALFCFASGGEAEAQRIEFDEPFGVALVVDGVLFEGDVG
jgi:hypothetical protein